MQNNLLRFGGWNLSEESGPDSENEDNDIELEYNALDNIQVNFCLIKICHYTVPNCEEW